MPSLDGKVAIVTGGARGLGRAYVQKLAAAGARVAAADRLERELAETAQAVREAGGTVATFAIDVTDRGAAEDMVGEAQRQLGPIDILVNNAGVAINIGPVWQSDPEQWWREVSINLFGEFLLARLVLPGMVAHGSGRVINVASTAGAAVGRKHQTAYNVSKAGVMRLTDGLAAELEGTGVKVFAIHPGGVRTPILDWVFTDLGDWLPELRNTVEHGPMVSTDPAAELVLRLASGEADALSGCFINATADLDQMLAHAEDIRARRLYVLKMETLG